MPNSLYLATNDQATGKRMVALGMMETIARRFDRFAFFRPIVRSDAENDPSISLMRSRYELVGDSTAMVGVNREQALEWLAADRYDDLLQFIQQRFKTLQERADFTLVEGTNFRGVASEIEFGLNIDLAMNLGCPILTIYSAAEKSSHESLQSIRIGNEGLRDRGGEILATIVNQVDPSTCQSLKRAQADNRIDGATPIYLIPEQPSLRRPTLREIMMGVDAALWVGDDDALDRESTTLKVAAMLLPDFLERIIDGSLVITPGDRAEILTGCVLANLLGEKSPSGVLLTGGIVPPPSIQQLICHQTGLPILTTNDDTFTAARRVSMVRARITRRSPRKVESALGLFEQHVDLDQLAQLLDAPAPQRVTPLLFEHSLIERATRRLDWK